MVQLGFYAHMKLALGVPAGGLVLSQSLWFAVAFMLVFSAVIALFENISDVKGDGQVRLMSSALKQEGVCDIGVCALCQPRQQESVCTLSWMEGHALKYLVACVCWAPGTALQLVMTVLLGYLRPGCSCVP